MSVQHPLLENLKDYARGLFSTAQDVAPGESGVITDEHPDLPMFCATIEKILEKGLRLQRSMFSLIGPTSPSPWTYFENFGLVENPTIPFTYRNAVFCVKDCRKVKTFRGKTRLLIRHCLIKRCLHAPLELLKKHGPQCWYHTDASVLGDEILMEMFLSIILQMTHLTFNLQLENCAFIDISWYLPTRTYYQLVPCTALGLRLTFVDNYAIIADIQPHSVVAELKDVEVGDVLEEINGQPITAHLKGSLKNIMQSGAKQPVAISIIKAYYKKTGKPYPAMVRILRDSNLDLDKMHLRRKSNTDQGSPEDPDDPLGILKDCSVNRDEQQTASTSGEECKPEMNELPGFRATYVGSINVGTFGTSDLIAPAIESVVKAQKDCEKPQEEVVIECQEIGMKVSELNSSTVMLRHSYMEITSCSQHEKNPNYFAYIAGEKPCNLATMFTCYVFHSNNKQHVLEILISMGQGFKRTHFVA